MHKTVIKVKILIGKTFLFATLLVHISVGGFLLKIMQGLCSGCKVCLQI